MPMRRGLYQSRNIVAIKVGMELGPQSVIEMARKFGLTTPIPPYPSIYIGAADVYPIEMIAAYSAFATLGTRAAQRRSCASRTAKGDVLWEPTPVRAPVMSPEEAWLMVSMMKDVVQRGTAAGSVGSQFHIPAGGKTGTTNDGADVWYIGYTSDLVAGVWMGLDKPKKIKGNAQGGVLAAPAWTAFMREVYRRKPASPDWPRPDGIVERQIDHASGQLVGARLRPGDRTEYFLAGTDPIATCIPLASPYSDDARRARRAAHEPRRTRRSASRRPRTPRAARTDTIARSSRIRVAGREHRHAGRRADPARVAPASVARHAVRSDGTPPRDRRRRATRATRSRFPRPQRR